APARGRSASSAPITGPPTARTASTAIASRTPLCGTSRTPSSSSAAESFRRRTLGEAPGVFWDYAGAIVTLAASPSPAADRAPDRAPNLAERLAGTPYDSYVYAYPHKTAYGTLDPARSLEEIWRDEDK